ncbi:hypothetical protein E0E62_33600, partial [Streptomyces sp. 16-176A]
MRGRRHGPDSARPHHATAHPPCRTTPPHTTPRTGSRTRTPEKGAPHMLGFSINVDNGAGAVCQTSYVHNGTWLDMVCDNPG